MEKYDLREALKKCKSGASSGQQIAKIKLDQLKTVLDKAKNEIETAKRTFEKSNCNNLNMENSFAEQLQEIQKSFNKLQMQLERDFKNGKKKAGDFSITLFGRTMAGKSTLMEILTEGDGNSIGKGAQRTTRDVRKYQWNNLVVTDVPGIGAFEGKEDETLAFEAARDSDLILFLLTDDAPQPEEADCFGRIIELGKPVMCVVNVKSAISENANTKLAIYDINKKFDKNRLEKIKNQFMGFANLIGQKWETVPFIYVHLKAAYMSQHMPDKEIAKYMNESSKIDDLKKIICDKVNECGEYFKMKYYIDLVSVPMFDSIDVLLSQSQKSYVQAKVLDEKKRRLNEWSQQFEKDGMREVSDFIFQIKSDLNRKIPQFAEQHYDDQNAAAAWKKEITKINIDEKCQCFLTEKKEQCITHITELAREIENELSFSLIVEEEKILNMEKITDDKRTWKWTTSILSCGVGIAGIIAGVIGSSVAGVLTIAGLAVGVVGWIFGSLFTSRAEKERKARRKLEEKLYDANKKMCEKIENEIRNKVREIKEKQIDSLCIDMQMVYSIVAKLSNTQRQLAWDISEKYLDMNKRNIKEALVFLKEKKYQNYIVKVARIPKINVIMINEKADIPYDIVRKIEKLIMERIYIIKKTDDKEKIINQVIWNEERSDKITIDSEKKIAFVDVKTVSPNEKNRMKLAQQLVELQILRK